MIKTYKIIDCVCRDEFDMEVIARIIDVETNVDMCVVINDHTLQQLSTHVNGIYDQLRVGDCIKGELFAIYTQQLDSTGNLYFKPRITSDHFKLSTYFEGEFSVDNVEENGVVVLENPDLNLTIKTGEDDEIDVKTNTVNLSGELYLKTIGLPFTWL